MGKGILTLRTSRRLIFAATMAALLLAAPSTASAATCPVDGGSAYASAIRSTAGLVSYWRLGESSGTSACDSYGSNAGSYQGAFSLGRVGALSGDPDTAVLLDGSTGIVNVPHASSLDVGDSFTVEAWVRRNSFGAPDYQAIASQGANAWLLAFNASNRLVLRQAKVGDLVSSTASVTDTGWHYVAVTKSGSSVRLYIDGTDRTGTVTNRTMANNALPLSLGQSSGTSFFNGTLDEVALYRAALPASTIQAHRDKGAVTPSPTPSPTPGPDPVIAAAGDIACDPGDSGYNGGNGTSGRCQQRATSNLIVNTGLTGIVTLGDEQYDEASLTKFQQVYAGTWGRANSLNHPGIGNHEYLTPAAAGYFDYFNGVGNQNGVAGPRDKGYYSFNLGTWHIVELNSNCSKVACSSGSSQDQWLRADLAANPTKCTLAFWHHPRWSSGLAGSNSNMGTLVTDLYRAGAEVILTGHDHLYERYAPQSPSAAAEPATGLREFIVGTGGKSLVDWSSIKPNSQVRNNTTFGVLRMTLHPSSYDWKFVPIAGQSFTDSGSTSCH
jgi:concanavalin A-like lectin/glucanase superfamily protein/calcineurin-like phosphoesterase family protein